MLYSFEGVAQTTHRVAPPSTNAGILDKTIEKEYEEAKPLEPKREIPVLEVDLPEDQLDLGPQRSIYFEDIEVEGCGVCTPKELRSVIYPYTNRKLSMADIRELCAKIRVYYVGKGYFLARAYPPAQDIKNNRLKIEVLEGKLGRISVSGNQYYTEKFIRSYFTKYIGKPLNYDAFLKSLMLVNENTDLAVGAIFEKGVARGTADVILKVQDKRPIHLYLNTNNYGNHSTSKQRSGLRLDVGNCIFNGATLSVAEVLGSPVEALNFTDVRYNFPINKSGLTGELSFLFSQFKIRDEDFDSLHMKGRSEIAGGKVTYAAQRNRRVSTDVYASFQVKQIKDIALGQTTADDRLRVASVGTDFSFGDGWGNNFVNFACYQGIPDFLGGSGERFTYLNLDYKRLQAFAADFFFLINFSGQWSFYKLPIPEQFYIGGMDTVRGYPLASALGDSGYYMNLELRLPPPFRNYRAFGTQRKWKEIFQFVAFVDLGGVARKGYVGMVSAGAGLRFYGPYNLDLNIDWGVPLNNQHKGPGSIWYWKLNWKI